MPLTASERGRFKRDQGIPETPAETLRAFGVDDCVRKHGRRAAERAEAAHWAEVARQTEREHRVANDCADVVAEARAACPSITKEIPRDSRTLRLQRCSQAAVLLEDEQGRPWVLWRPCSKSCPVCGPVLLGDRLDIVKKATTKFAAVVPADGRATLNRRLNRHEASANHFPISTDLDYTVASEWFEGAEPVDADAIDRIGEVHLDYVRSCPKGRARKIGSVGAWKVKSRDDKSLAGFTFHGLVGVPPGRRKAPLEDLCGGVEYVTTSSAAWIGYRGRRPLDAVGWTRLERQLDVRMPGERYERGAGIDMELLADIRRRRAVA